ncbi:MAG: D-2-hydroxyacid dehydrogenase [Dehalococcoidia bacterium]|nr:D-2-hydroxyacid dehydrogenase [Dehalococcoidia bacterium]
MAQFNILVNAPIFENLVPAIEAVDPRVKATFVGDLLKAEREGNAGARHQLDSLLATADAYSGMRLPENMSQRAPQLKWIQLTSAGVDHVLSPDLLRSQVILTNVANLHSFVVAEFAITACLALAKNVNEFHRQKECGEWQPVNPVIMRGKTMGIVGFGHIGRRVARVARALDIRVVGLRRSTQGAKGARYADELLASTDLARLLSESDFVVLTVPLTAETHHLIGARELSLMKKTAFLVNVARGPLVDEVALATALRDGEIAGAALDVFDTEPLPADSPLREIRNLFFSPHVAGWIEEYPSMVLEVLQDNIGRYLNGRRLKNVVNKQRGY